MKILLLVVCALFAAIMIGCGGNAEDHVERGLKSNSKGDYDEAIESFTEAIRLDPKSVLAYYNRGYAWGMKYEHDNAIQDLTETIRLDPNLGLAYFARGIEFGAKNQHDEAIKDYTEAIRIDPDFAAAHNNRGISWNAKGEPDKAIEDFEAAIQIDPLSPSTLNQLAWIYATCSDANSRNGKQAVVYATKACEISEWRDAPFLDTLAAAHAESGDFGKAVEWQEKALKIATNERKTDMEARLNLYKAEKPYLEK